MTNVLVTGGAGYIGSHTAKVLAGAGYAPVSYDNLSAGHRWAVQHGPLVEGDLADRHRIADTLKASGATAVIHFAAHAYVGESMRDPLKYFRNNVAGSLALLEAMRDAGVNRIIFSSTCATYGQPDRLPIAEDQPQRPINPYGETKLAVEHMLRWCDAAYGLRFVALRYFNAAGADPEGQLGEAHDPETHLVPLAIDAARGVGPALNVFGTDYATPDGTAIRDYIHVMDLARAHVAALRYLEGGGTSDAFNLGTGTGVSVSEVVRAVEAAAGRPVPVRLSGRREGDPAVLVADPAKARRILGWHAEESSLSSIVNTAWQWHQQSRSEETWPATPSLQA